MSKTRSLHKWLSRQAKKDSLSGNGISDAHIAQESERRSVKWFSVLPSPWDVNFCLSVSSPVEWDALRVCEPTVVLRVTQDPRRAFRWCPVRSQGLLRVPLSITPALRALLQPHTVHSLLSPRCLERGLAHSW